MTTPVPLLTLNLSSRAPDFVLAFETGRIIESALRARERDGQSGTGRGDLPTVVIVTKDVGLEVVVDELQQCDVACKLVKSVAELGEMLRAMDILEQDAAARIRAGRIPEGPKR